VWVDTVVARQASCCVVRDVTPENVFLQNAGDDEIGVKLLDFGVAGVTEQNVAERAADPKLTRAGAVLGTPLYMSPEQALGRTVSARADIWSVGALLYQALAGAPPYNGNSFHELVVSISTQEHVPIGALRPDLPPRVHAVVERALRKDPQKRWSSASEMASALASAVEGRSTAHDAGTLGVSALASEPSARPAPPAAAPDGSGLSPLRMIVLGMGAVIVLGAIGYIATLGPWSRRDARTSSTPVTAEPEAGAALAAAPLPQAEAAGGPALAVHASVARGESPAARAAPAHEDSQAPPVPVPVPVTAPAPPPAPEAHGLSSEALSAVLSAAQAELQRCYERAMVAALTAGKPPLPALAFDVSLRVSPAGRVERAQVAATEDNEPPALRACLQAAIDGLRFPTAGAASEARFPVVFQPAVVGP
jgi:serine/threonine-protein kinase